MTRTSPVFLFVAAFVFFTSSFDIFLTVDAGPTLRVAQLASLVLVAGALVKWRMGLGFELPLGALWLLPWFAMQLAFVPVVSFWQKSLAYCAWLALDAALCFVLVNLFSRCIPSVNALLTLYLASFVFVACFGIVQFVLPLGGGPALLVEQWWLPGRVPRVNAFSYEPSYLATYLILGLVCLGSLRRSGDPQYRARRWTTAYLIILASIVLCSSRMGIAFAAVELALGPARRLWRAARTPALLLHARVSLPRIVLLAACAVGALSLISAASSWIADNPETIRILVSGTGLLGTAAHSVDERQDHLDLTLKAISDHPWMGTGLGGVTEAIASYAGQKPQSFGETKIFEGQSVFAEVVAASGVPGSVFFFCFAATYIIAPLRLARVSPRHAAWLRALVVSLIFEWGILQFNQNILRLYLWVHLAVLATVFAAARHQYAPGDSDALLGGYGSPNLFA